MEPAPNGNAISATTSAAQQPLSEEQLLAALSQPIEPVKVSIFYRFGLLLVAAAMILLPLLYLCLIVLLGWGVYLHTIHDIGLIQHAPRGRAAIFAFAAYIGPIIAGVVAILFMFKPLLAPRPKAPNNVVLDPGRQPLLYRFVERLCATVKAPMPRHIEVDCEVNASARLRRGMLSFFGNDLVLTIGLPLVAGLNLRQLTGVLAHEFGHFAQGGAMRLSYVVRSINGWFARVVYERDAWDAKLEQWTRQSEHVAISLVLLLTRGVVWLSRKVLWLLMMLGHAISCFLLRQMEYDADRYEARIAGSDTFEETAKQIAVLSLGSQAAFSDLGRAWSEKRLGDDLTALIHSRVGSLPADVVSNLHKEVLEHKTGLLDTHPADRDRIASARREGAPGVVRFDHPATLLFKGFDGLSQRATLKYYRDVVGLNLSHSNLVSTADLVADQKHLEEAHRALASYFQHGQIALRPLALGADITTPPDDPDQLLGTLRAARQGMEAATAGARATARRFGQFESRLMSLAGAAALIDAGVKIKNPAAFDVPTGDPVELGQEHRRTHDQMAQTVAARAEFEAHAATRLTTALRFLHAPLLSTRIADAGTMQQQLTPLRNALAGMAELFDLDTQMRVAFARAAMLLNNVEAHNDEEQYIKQTLADVAQLQQRLAEVRNAVSTTAYPFSHASGTVNIGDFLLEELPLDDDIAGVMNAAQHLMGADIDLYFRILAELCTMAAQVEQALGLPPLPEPPKDEG